MIFHDDDMMHSDFIKEEICFMENNQDYAAVSCKSIDVNEKGECISTYGNNDGKIYTFSGADLFNAYIDSMHYLVFPTIMYRDSFIKEHNILLDKMVGPSCDVKSYFDIEKNGGKVATIDKCLLMTGVHSGRDSSINRTEMLIKLLIYLKND